MKDEAFRNGNLASVEIGVSGCWRRQEACIGAIARQGGGSGGADKDWGETGEKVIEKPVAVEASGDDFIEVQIPDGLADWALPVGDSFTANGWGEEVFEGSAEEGGGIFDPNPFIGELGIERHGELPPDGVSEDGQAGIPVGGAFAQRAKRIAEKQIIPDSIQFHQENPPLPLRGGARSRRVLGIRGENESGKLHGKRFCLQPKAEFGLFGKGGEHLGDKF